METPSNRYMYIPNAASEEFTLTPLPQPVTLSKNEYIALELTKAWCGQRVNTGSIWRKESVAEAYEYFRDELEEE